MTDVWKTSQHRPDWHKPFFVFVSSFGKFAFVRTFRASIIACAHLRRKIVAIRPNKSEHGNDRRIYVWQESEQDLRMGSIGEGRGKGRRNKRTSNRLRAAQQLKFIQISKQCVKFKLNTVRFLLFRSIITLSVYRFFPFTPTMRLCCRSLMFDLQFII